MRKRSTQGITLVEAAVLVCIVGALLAAFVPTFIREMRTSKISEASEALTEMHRGAATYFAARFDKPSGRRVGHCLPTAAGPAPARATVDPVEVSFAAEETPGATTWRALSFEPHGPTRYRYTFAPEASGCELRGQPGLPLLSVRAEGDLDGDGKHSLFERTATVDEDGVLVPLGVLHVVDRVE